MRLIPESEISDECKKVLVKIKEEGQTLYLIISRGGDENYLIVDFNISKEKIDGYENIGEYKFKEPIQFISRKVKPLLKMNS